jgi:glutamate formiminotransferase/glutamate formiminotransferase/formiminotetrahydrofolate cyclodeaminase
VLLAVPNFSEGRDLPLVGRIATQFSSGVELLDSHSDPVHNRTVLTLGGPSKALGEALIRGLGACQMTIDMRTHDGAHPCIGALDVCPIVWLREGDRDAARQEALAVAGAMASQAGVPVFLYGDLASQPARHERAYFRNGGILELRRRMAARELTPDFGPAEPHPSAGATLVTARPPLAAFNVELAGADIDTAGQIAARLRESGDGLPGVRALGIDLGGGRTQVSTNVHDPVAVPLARVIERVGELAAESGVRVTAAEIVGLVPEAALDGLPQDLRLTGFDPARHLIERRVRG